MLRHSLGWQTRSARVAFSDSVKASHGERQLAVRSFATANELSKLLFGDAAPLKDKRKAGDQVVPAKMSIRSKTNISPAISSARTMTSARIPMGNGAGVPLSAILNKKLPTPLESKLSALDEAAKQAQPKKRPLNPSPQPRGVITDILKSFGTPTNSSLNSGSGLSSLNGGLLNQNLQDSFNRKKKLTHNAAANTAPGNHNGNGARKGHAISNTPKNLNEIQASANAITENLLELIHTSKEAGRARHDRKQADIERNRARRSASMPEGPSSTQDTVGRAMSVNDFKNSFRPGFANAPAGKRGKSAAVAAPPKPAGTIVKEVVIPDTGMTARELAIAMSMKSKDLLKQLTALGESVRDDDAMLDADVAEIVVLDKGLKVKRLKVEGEFGKRQLREASTEALTARSPVVCVMGHVDHGKTSLLDALRKSKVAAGEAGGITQRLAAFSVCLQNFVKNGAAAVASAMNTTPTSTTNGSVVFLDTPGHAAFSAMRSHGANATDIACIVVAAVEGVQPQTIESINFAKQCGASIVVAISKIDRIPESQRAEAISRIKSQLADLEVISEDFGGDVPVVPISSVTGYGVQELVEQLLLQAEVLELQAVNDGAAQSVVLDTNTERGVGFVADVLVQWGKLKIGDIFVVGGAYGKVRQITDSTGRTLREAGPSTPVRISGLKALPAAGEELLVVQDEARARDIAARRQRLAQLREMRDRQEQTVESDNSVLHLMLKADTHGTMDALKQIVAGIRDPDMQINTVAFGVGPVTRSDVQMAVLASRCPILCFNVGFGDTSVKGYAKEEDVNCLTHDIIYRLEDNIRDMILNKLPKIPVLEKKGHARVQQIFQLNDKKKTSVAGCIVSSGVLRSQGRFRVMRGDNPVSGFLHADSLRRHKDIVQEVSSGSDCGLVLSKFSDLRDGDMVEFFEIVHKPKRLVKGDDILFEQEPAAEAESAESTGK